MCFIVLSALKCHNIITAAVMIAIMAFFFMDACFNNLSTTEKRLYFTTTTGVKRKEGLALLLLAAEGLHSVKQNGHAHKLATFGHYRFMNQIFLRMYTLLVILPYCRHHGNKIITVETAKQTGNRNTKAI